LPKPSEGSSTTDQLIQTFLVTQICQLTQQQQPSELPYTLPMSIYPPLLAPSSPVWSDSDPSEILAQFFDWFIQRSSEQQREMLGDIRQKLLDEDWNLETLCDKRKGGAMTVAIWESYSFKLDTLANIKSKISEFKQQQRPQSHSSNGSSSSL
jgi:hypothetical protein